MNIEKNIVNIDWLSINFKKVNADDVLKTFCDCTASTDLKVENFIQLDRGIVTGFSGCYSYLGQNIIVISFSPIPHMGVNLQVTGSGLKLIGKKDILKFMAEMSKLTDEFRCNRLDLAYNDFDGTIPVDEMLESTLTELDPENNKRSIMSKIKREFISVYTNNFDNRVSHNLVFGKHRCVRSFRLYDKKTEQKLTSDECNYWYRLEIELHSKGPSRNADIAFRKFLAGDTAFQVFFDELKDIITFIKPQENITNNVSIYSLLVADFWQNFLNVLHSQLTSHNMYYAKLR